MQAILKVCRPLSPAAVFGVVALLVLSGVAIAQGPTSGFPVPEQPVSPGPRGGMPGPVAPLLAVGAGALYLVARRRRKARAAADQGQD